MSPILYSKSMIFVLQQIAKWAEKEPNHPTVNKMQVAMRNVHEYVEELEVDNRRMRRTIVEMPDWDEQEAAEKAKQILNK